MLRRGLRNLYHRITGFQHVEAEEASTMIHPDIQRLMAADRIETLRHDAWRPARNVATVREDTTEIELRLCRVSDNCALADLAALSERVLPKGSFVLAVVDGRLVAALPIDGGPLLTDPFVRTTHLRRLLELRAAQIREPHGRATLRRLVRRSAVV
jgi:hypothetical protein